MHATRRYYAGRCEHCETTFTSATRPQLDEDGSPDYDCSTLRCKGCGAKLCEQCLAKRKAFHCERCHELFCSKCQRNIDDEHYCPACYTPALADAYEGAAAELAAAKREIAAYRDECGRIAVLFGRSDIERAAQLGLARGIATNAPFVAQSAALSAA